MDKIFLEVSQMLENHPIKEEKTSYKLKYINLLEYFVNKYSKEDVWATATLKLYIKKLLGNECEYTFEGFDFQKQSKRVIRTRVKPFKVFNYRYCLVFDCILINAYNDKIKAEKVFSELATIYHKRYQKKIEKVFSFLFDSRVSLEGIEMITYMKDCWEKNSDFLSEQPTKVLVTANMSAGKSTLLNALVGRKVNKTQNDACTAKIHYVVNKSFDDNLCYEWDHLLELDADIQTLMEDNVNNDKGEITVGTYFRTVNPEHKRLWFIDTPGVNSSQDQYHKQIAENTIQSVNADLLIYLLNGENIGTDDDRKHLLFVLENYSGDILFVVNKVDRFRKKEDSISETIDAIILDLTEMGFENPKVVPVSAYAGFLAKKSIYGELIDEDEQDEYNRMSKKLSKPEYQFDMYYPTDIQQSVINNNNNDNYQLLMHSGILQLEKIIYNLRR